jgi:2-dehydro-3-deoxyphosphogluconate aldolase/(4S)-4-hydroxy-2-oxoglutarate aldolase
MDKDKVRSSIEEIGVIPALRMFSEEDARFAADAVTEAGVPIVEVTMTVPGALAVIADLARHNPNLIVGAGTVFDLDTARRCLDAGASFLTSTGLDLAVVEFAVAKGVVVLPGALTPTEVMAAWKAGADFVKIFPCAQVGGPAYIKALKAPFRHVPLIAAGGVNQQTAAAFIRAGAVALGIGKDLIPQDAIKRRESHRIQELAHRYLDMVKTARGQQVRPEGSSQ